MAERGDRYADTTYAPAWVDAKGLQWQALAEPLARGWRSGRWPEELRVSQVG